MSEVQAETEAIPPARCPECGGACEALPRGERRCLACGREYAASGKSAGGSGLGRGLALAVLGFAPAFVVFVSLAMAKAMGVPEPAAELFTACSFLAGFIYVCWWSGSVVTANPGSGERFFKRFALSILLMACNFVLSIAGCAASYPFRLN